ncbi:hypothetical protein [Microbacterium sp. Kw_RZR3]|jgi:hypothetical protein|uniref:hypothetical protein n=1 Tax=unclassified Microbacterium TaxID=2609290 RepID=UPI0023DB0A04|nr:hypothetical protein [Microbacterium sp. Kw_RZR3]MDF2046073.1 hypothetical protein [Microbacterium sp. Kw_RZR3]MDF2508527.1 hypothetical protein [Microbacterium sp.]
MNTPQRRWISLSLAAGVIALAGIGGVAAMSLPANANATTAVSTPAPHVRGSDATDTGGDGETADDQVGETPDQESADDPGHEDGTADGETGDDAPTG